MDRGATRGLGAALRPGLALALLVVPACGDQHGAVASAAAAAVRVEAEGCGSRALVGGGAFVGLHRVVTVAHVVAGSTDVDVTLADGTELDASVVAIDRGKDLALLAVDADVSPLPFGRMRPGETGTFVVERDGRFVEQPFTAEAFVSISADDIDHLGTGVRKGFRLRADVQRGDSGSVLVRTGQAVGVVFARSDSGSGTAWATDIREVTHLLRGATDLPVDVGACP